MAHRSNCLGCSSNSSRRCKDEQPHPVCLESGRKFTARLSVAKWQLWSLPPFAYRSLWNVGKSLDVSLCGVDDRRPAGNFTLHQCGEWLLTSLCLARNGTADIDQALSHVVVVQCLIQRVAKPVQYRSRHALRRKQAKPWQCLEFRQPTLLRCRDIRQSRVTFSGRDCVCLNGPGLNVRSDFNCEAHVVDLAAEQRSCSRRNTAEWYRGWLYAEQRVEQETEGKRY